ncbi:MAG TPA: LLM class flavin-dependent oxidoreductase [Thermoplasmata archaeon]|nr:LLM class flavin-dependent oxidoreductase [Thermoplasmata archaeon]
MRFGAFSVLDTYPELAVPCEDRTVEVLGHCVLAERLGFSTFWVTEHHFRPSSVLPSPPVWIAAASGRTRSIRLGSLVSVLPLHDPLQLAEEFALADRLSGGRVEIGVGPGYVASEFDALGRDPKERHRDFAERLPEFIAALSGARLPFRRELDRSVRLNVLPIQRPTPPVWVAAAHKESIRSAARAGLGVALMPCMTLEDVEEVQGLVDAFRSGLPPGVPPRVLVALPVYRGDSETVGRRACARFLRTRPLGDGELHRSGPPLRRCEADLDARGLAVLRGSSSGEDLISDLARMGVTDCAAIFDFGGLPARVVRRSMRRWAAESSIWSGHASGSTTGSVPPRDVPRQGSFDVTAPGVSIQARGVPSK